MTIEFTSYRDEALFCTIFKARVQFHVQTAVSDTELHDSTYIWPSVQADVEARLKLELLTSVRGWLEAQEEEGVDRRPLQGPPTPRDLMSEGQRIMNITMAILRREIERPLWDDSPMTFDLIQKANRRGVG